MNGVASLLRSSIFRKQVVAVTGIMLVGFIVGHLGGNLLILIGPDVFNAYAEKLQSLGKLLWVVRLGLIAAVVLHIYFTILLTLENRAARGDRYAVANTKADQSQFAKKTMIYTGILLFLFIFLHIYDFTLADKHGPGSVVEAAGTQDSLGLYGVVWNGFTNPLRNLIYVLAVCSVGFHTSHGIQSLFQTLGFFHERYTPLINRASIAIGLLLAVGFSVIPLYVMLRHYTIGIGV
jgi:succinate dehydrogenase cytochrome b subunit